MKLIEKIQAPINKITVEDYDGIEIGSIIPAKLKSFNYYQGLCFGVFVVSEVGSLRCIIGDTAEFPMDKVMLMKGQKYDILFNGISDDGLHPKLSLQL